MKKIFVVVCCLCAFVAAGQGKKTPMSVLDSEIKINGGSRYTREMSVELEFRYANCSLVMLSNTPDFSGATWVKYNPKIPKMNWSLAAGDGKKTIFAKFKNEDGVESKVFQNMIMLDTTPPENPYIKIDVPTSYFNKADMKVSLIISAVDAEMFMVSNQSNFQGQQWRRVKEDKVEWELEKSADGPRKVYVKFRDKAGNESAPATDEVIVDTQVPIGGKVTIEKNAEFLTLQSKKITVDFFANGADSLIVSQSPDFANAKWEAYTTSAGMTLEGEDGKKTVYVKYKDKAGNTTPVYTDDIFLDINPPSNCKLTIDNGAEKTVNENKFVKLTLEATDAAMIQVSNSPSFKGARWENFRKEITNWKLDGEEDGLRSVYVKFKDAAGNVTSAIKAEITLERGF